MRRTRTLAIRGAKVLHFSQSTKLFKEKKQKNNNFASFHLKTMLFLSWFLEI